MPVDRHIEDQTDHLSIDFEVEGKSGELDFNTLKTGGIIKQRQKDLVTVRLKCPGGRLNVDRLSKIAEVARRFGGDYVHLSFRQSIEIPYVNFHDLARVRDQLAEIGQEIASCGPRVRVPTACSGCEYNPNGLTDTQKMAQEVCDRYFGTGDFPHKFKISLSGCPIDCARTDEMELGFQGAMEPEWHEEACTSCGICIEACREGAIVRDENSDRPCYLREECLHCGDCVRACPFDAWQSKRIGWMVRCGGKHGRHPIHGQRIAEFVPDENILEIIGAVHAWYEKKSKGQGRIRLGTLLMHADAWNQFLSDIGPVLGEWAVRNPPAPRCNEIHS